MQIKSSVKIHNRFDVEVFDIETGTSRVGFAENIVLDAAWDLIFSNFSGWGNYIHFGSGDGTLSPSRNSLFNFEGAKLVQEVELILNEDGLPCKRTCKIQIDSLEHVGVILSEVGLGSNLTQTTLRTHAKLKDSEGNPLTLGPKTDTEQITIYASVFLTFVPNECNIKPILSSENIFIRHLLGLQAAVSISTPTTIVSSNGIGLYLSSNGDQTNQFSTYSTQSALHGFDYSINDIPNKIKKSKLLRVETNQSNFKIKSIVVHQGSPQSNNQKAAFRAVIPNSMFPGNYFEGLNIGVGDGVKTLFTLPWNEARFDKPYKVYKDLVELTSGFTFGENDISFITPPNEGEIITADYWVDYLPKDINHVIDIQFSISCNEGV